MLFAVIEALQSRGQAVASGIGKFNGMFQVISAHHPEDRSKELSEVRVAPRFYSPLQWRLPE